MELKPFLYEEEVRLAKDFKLMLRMDYSVIAQLEATFAPKGMHQLLGELATSMTVMTQFLWFTTREHHPDLTHDVIAGLQFSEKHGQVLVAKLGKLLKDAFKLAGADG